MSWFGIARSMKFWRGHKCKPFAFSMPPYAYSPASEAFEPIVPVVDDGVMLMGGV